MRPVVLRIGTRGSPLALAQAHEVQRLLCARHGLEPDAIAVQIIRTTGDRIQDPPLAEAGGKGLFTKEIEEALLAGMIDLAVHSAKDLPACLPNRLHLAACLPREDPRDAFISRRASRLAGLPRGALVGTASPRREALVKRLRPDLRVTSLRGNVETRIRKLEAGIVDATLLAIAGLKRLGRPEAVTAVFEIDEFLPAVGQGVIAIETRAGDARVLELVRTLDHPATHVAFSAERAFLAALDGSCRTPIAGYASIESDRVHLRGMIVRPDGQEAHETTRTGAIADAAVLGAEAGQELKARAPASFFARE